LLFLGEGEITRFVEVVNQYWTFCLRSRPNPGKSREEKIRQKEKAEAKAAVPPEVGKAVERLLDGGKAADVALFGRMLADLPEKTSTPPARSPMPFPRQGPQHGDGLYTAVDDLKPSDTAGADMIGTVEFNSSCFYRYANLDVTELIGGFRGESKKPFGL